jgi:hypothetical protein
LHAVREDFRLRSSADCRNCRAHSGRSARRRTGELGLRVGRAAARAGDKSPGEADGRHGRRASCAKITTGVVLHGEGEGESCRRVSRGRPSSSSARHAAIGCQSLARGTREASAHGCRTSAGNRPRGM